MKSKNSRLVSAWCAASHVLSSICRPIYPLQQVLCLPWRHACKFRLAATPRCCRCLLSLAGLWNSPLWWHLLCTSPQGNSRPASIRLSGDCRVISLSRNAIVWELRVRLAVMWNRTECYYWLALPERVWLLIGNPLGQLPLDVPPCTRRKSRSCLFQGSWQAMIACSPKPGPQRWRRLLSLLLFVPKNSKKGANPGPKLQSTLT